MAIPLLQRYGIAFRKYKWYAAATFVCTVLGAGAYGINQPPVRVSYVYEGVLVSNNPPGVFSETGAQIIQAGQALDQSVLNAEDVQQAAAQALKLARKEVQEGLNVKVKPPKEGSQLQVEVRRVGENRKLTEAVVNAMMAAMIEKSYAVNTSLLNTKVEAIKARLPAVVEELRLAEQALESFNRKEEADILAAQGGGLVGAIADSRQQQRQLRLTLEGIDAQIRSLEGRLGLSVDQAYVSSALSADPIIASLRSQIHSTESQLAILSRDLRPQHPSIVELQNQKQAYEQLLQQRAAEVIGGDGVAAPLVQGGSGSAIRQDSNLDPTRQQLANTLVNLQTQRDTLQQQLEAAIRTEQELRTEYASIPNKQLEQARLAQDVALKKALHDRIQAALVDAQAAQAETVTSLQLAQPATQKEQIIDAPISRYLLLAGGGVGGAVLGGALVFGLSVLEGRFYVTAEIETALKQQEAPLLGLLPTLPPVQESHWPGLAVLPLLNRLDAFYGREYEILRSVLGRLGERGARVILVTSPGVGEGKTVTAYNLAMATARVGKRVVLLEADLRQETISQQLGLARNLDSATEPLNYYGQISECLLPVPEVDNLYLIPSVGPQGHPAAILESSEMQGLVRDCKGRFDVVIIDAPAFLSHNDGLLLEPLTDGLLVVLRPGYSRPAQLKTMLDQIEAEKIPLLGVVVNDGFVPDRPIAEPFTSRSEVGSEPFAVSAVDGGYAGNYGEAEGWGDGLNESGNGNGSVNGNGMGGDRSVSDSESVSERIRG